jgi:hypothetical protein
MTSSAPPDPGSASPVADTAIRPEDLRSAVAAGILSGDMAQRLQAHAAQAQSVIVGGEDEQLRLVTGFADIFVTIGLALFLGALGYLSGGAWIVVVPVAAWLLAELFTRMKRMALPSIVLLVVFVGSVFSAAFFTLGDDAGLSSGGPGLAAAGLLACGAAGLHWLRFRVPITIAAACAAGVGIVAGLAGWAWPGILLSAPALIFLPLGLLTFALAMRFDMSDRMRRSRRTDIAFWLHMLAAPLIVHSVVRSIADSGNLSLPGAVAILLLFALLSVVALVIDRRALLVSSLIYLGYALAALFENASLTATFATGTAPTVLVVGATILVLSIAWHPLRRILLQAVPTAVRNLVPPAHLISNKPIST